MVRRLSGLLLIAAVAVAAAAIAQQPATAPKPISMPSDRAADSYAIYSLLLPSNAIEGSDAPRTFWLIEDTTLAGCGDPKGAIQAPKGREADLQALVDDCNRHRGEAIALSADGFHTALPVRLADETARKRFRSSVQFGGADAAAKAEFDGSAGMHMFSQVYFNPNHSLAMVCFGIYCGELCGQSTWVVLERKDGKWVRLPWAIMSVIS
jgi:hypothetical protein